MELRNLKKISQKAKAKNSFYTQKNNFLFSVIESRTVALNDSNINAVEVACHITK